MISKELLSEREQINIVFAYIMNKKLSTDEMLEELAEVQPQLYREYTRLTGHRYIEDRLPEIKGQLEYISDRWATPERIAFILTALGERI